MIVFVDYLLMFLLFQMDVFVDVVYVYGLVVDVYVYGYVFYVVIVSFFGGGLVLCVLIVGYVQNEGLIWCVGECVGFFDGVYCCWQ